jgi:AcrR family transcriptional regulator
VDERLSAKGERHAAQILDAAVRCLARDGYAATSLQRVADEAGLGKRTVIYYYGTREGLFDHVVRKLADQLVDQLKQAIGDAEEPADMIARGFGPLWAAITEDRALLVAWLGLVAESITNPALRDASSSIAQGFRDLLSALLDDALARGRTLRLERGSLEILVLAGMRGLILEYLERGPSPELELAISDFQRMLGDVTLPPA